MFRVAICEDYPLHAEIMAELLNNYQAERPSVNISTCCFASGEELLESFLSGNSFDLLLLDILLPGLNGIELAEKIRKLNDDVLLIFITESEDYSLEAFNVSATQYIIKPVKEKNLFPVLDRILHLLGSKKERFFTLSMPERIVKIPFSSIISIELVQRTLLVSLEDGSKLTSKYVREPFAEIIAPLIQDNRFLYAHKSYILNMARAKELLNDHFVMEQEIIVPVPRYKYPDVKEKFCTYLRRA